MNWQEPYTARKNSSMKVFQSFVALLVIASVLPGIAEPIRIDLGMDSGRNDTATPGWHEWQVPNGPKASRDFAGVTLILRGGGGDLEGQWYKAGLVSGATMATDGVMAPSFEVEIHGLKPGPHSLVTYHNGFSKAPLATHQISLVEGNESASVGPSVQATTNEVAASAYLEFTTQDDNPIVLRIAADQGDSVLNGIEIDGTNPKSKALSPLPTDNDDHADGDEGVIELAWQPATTAVTHHVYLASAEDDVKAREIIAKASAESSEHQGTMLGGLIRKMQVARSHAGTFGHFACGIWLFQVPKDMGDLPLVDEAGASLRSRILTTVAPAVCARPWKPRDRVRSCLTSRGE
jgi:hypothetical protein